MKKQSEQQKLEWFNKLRLNSWEVEILIVGFVLVMMLQIPESLDAIIEKLTQSSPMLTIYEAASWFGKIAMIWVTRLCINILIISFTIYLGLRGFWVGLIGFSSVYPNGINIKKLNYNKIFSKQLEKHSFNDYIVSVDNACSMIFSFSFFFSFSIISLLMFCIQILLIVAFKAYLMDHYRFVLPAYNILFHWPHLLFGVIYFLDFTSISYLKKIKWRPFGIFYNFIDKFFTYTTLIFVYKPLYYAIVSNIKQRVLIGASTIFVFCYGVSSLFNSSANAAYFPFNENQSENIMKNIYYENKFIDINDKHILPEYPFINAEIISDGYLKLYVPYFWDSNAFFEKKCDDIENINFESINPEQEQAVLNCINEFYIITIDDASIKSDFIFYHYSKLGVEMQIFFMPIETSNLDNGKHLIKITENFSRDRELKLDESNYIMEIERDGKIYTIPFYVFKD